ncbi:MAG: hypothetical protein DIU69_09980, partial [Bacillota bacterium]
MPRAEFSGPETATPGISRVPGPGGAGMVRRLIGHRSALVGGCIVLAFVLMAVLAPYLAPYDPINDASLDQRLQPPSAE